ncbi:glutathione S-transferase [Nitrospirillum amazonense]|uniref:Glutathione S-transferase n=1 Tax=Nitrospirillum amazonense TaxID=28077 RepID=A0A560ETU5_9PROT|nr:glutathione S-transferase [Nitrospirillum amazonense]
MELGDAPGVNAPAKAARHGQTPPVLFLGDGTVIDDVPAIWRYLEEAYPERPLLGATPKDKALVAMWDRWVETEGLNPVKATAARRDQPTALDARNRQRLTHFLADLDSRLSAAVYMAGDAFSAADITALITIDVATRTLGVPLPRELGAVRRWFYGLSTRASAWT